MTNRPSIGTSEMRRYAGLTSIGLRDTSGARLSGREMRRVRGTIVSGTDLVIVVDFGIVMVATTVNIDVCPGCCFVGHSRFKSVHGCKFSYTMFRLPARTCLASH